MNAASFFGDFIRRFGCTVNLRTGREFDANGRPSDGGGACEQCGACNRVFGDVGMAGAGVSLVNALDGLSLRWACPQCGNDVHEDTSLLGSFRKADEALADALCWPCRRRSTNARGIVSPEGIETRSGSTAKPQEPGPEGAHKDSGPAPLQPAPADAAKDMP